MGDPRRENKMYMPRISRPETNSNTDRNTVWIDIKAIEIGLIKSISIRVARTCRKNEYFGKSDSGSNKIHLY